MLQTLIAATPQVKDAEVDILEQYIPLVEFLGEAMGSSCEVVLHDLAVPDESIVAIANGHISGRKLGGPVTNFALWFMKQGLQDGATSMSGYRAVNSEGRVCRSSSYFIRDAAGELRGMLCINVDVTELMCARNAIGSMLDTMSVSTKPAPSSGGTVNVTELAQAYEQSAAEVAPPQAKVESDGGVVMEDLRSNLETMLASMLDAAVATQDIPTERMQATERISVVKALDEAGFFLLKGGIAAAAERLGVSEPTVYRYLVKARA
ncbi:transcriptional regulator [Corynebacterium atypicum]|uniref:Transcriptional regulator n=1 Tax=Corynebacterium atypicum TaxID=191610 RepID=A0ABM5QKS3_9CORY|nr:transcriptional regulator [Corynebacterium atypicum]AIG63372.1 transcriptional regulator [Corynebacterium atypicum]